MKALWAVAVIVALFPSCQNGAPDSHPPPDDASSLDSSVAAAFANLEPVSIAGYTGPQEDPVISPDGQHLFFDSHDDSSSSSSLYWANRIDYKTFQFAGEVQGVNFPGQMTLRGNYDLAHDFYFVSTKFLTACGMIAEGHFDNGAVTGIASIRGICAPPPPAGDTNVTFDVAITPDGGTLYFTEAVVNGSGPQTSRIAVATKNSDGSFTRLPDSDAIFQNVNALAPLVYNSAPTPDDIALFFTPGVLAGKPGGIFVAMRSSTSEPFGTPARLTQADSVQGFAEMGAISPDGTHLYLHGVASPTSSQIYVMTRQ